MLKCAEQECTVLDFDLGSQWKVMVLRQDTPSVCLVVI